MIWKPGVNDLVDKPKDFPSIKANGSLIQNENQMVQFQNTKPVMSRKAIHKFTVKITLKLFHPLCHIQQYVSYWH